jgi:hypothetical protein
MNYDNMAGTNGPVGPGRPDSGKAALAVNGVIAAVGGTYASTHSFAVTGNERSRLGARPGRARCWRHPYLVIARRLPHRSLATTF